MAAPVLIAKYFAKSRSTYVPLIISIIIAITIIAIIYFTSDIGKRWQVLIGAGVLTIGVLIMYMPIRQSYCKSFPDKGCVIGNIAQKLNKFQSNEQQLYKPPSVVKLPTTEINLDVSPDGPSFNDQLKSY